MKHRILIAEDEGLISEAYRLKLIMSGYDVLTTWNGEETLTKLREWNPHLLLLDILMPKLDGFQVLESMQRQEVLRGIPVVILSNVGEPEHVDRARKLGAREYIVKADFDIAKLADRIRAHLPTNAEA